ncbi:hypothetical protein AVEN_152315-1 [Araneus ventricosus]|uniref:Uncharacterized protein n=1 Tax=Araneus ventricosus TaxID=182803 RepID=A0A4Y2X245_ARAVE|nr:hypothetical protein AVEN_152315-1 [Araneus ventricosus]
MNETLFAPTHGRSQSGTQLFLPIVCSNFVLRTIFVLPGLRPCCFFLSFSFEASLASGDESIHIICKRVRCPTRASSRCAPLFANTSNSEISIDAVRSYLIITKHSLFNKRCDDGFGTEN